MQVRPFGALLVSAAILALAVPAVRAANLPTGFSEELLASGLAAPTAMQLAPDGRLFVCEQGGRLRVIKNGELLTTPFLTVTVSSAGERGLLGVAFDPSFETNRFVYVYYTATTPTIHNRLSRFTANGDVAVAGSEVVILELNNLSSATNHNGGALAFGPDGKLYVAVGENATPAHAQSMGNLFGKILRINRDGTIPTGNPFYNSASGKNRAIWALGLRNPFTFAFDPAGNDLFINDVGQMSWEEINEGLAGANYGWPLTEGPTNNPHFTGPKYAYSHSGGACAITGGAFYSPQAIRFPSSYYNDYFFADFCAGWIRKLDSVTGTVVTFATGISSPVDLKVGNGGRLYYLARGASPTGGRVYRVDYGVAEPTITSHPASRTVAPGASVTFAVTASGAAPLRYQWQRNGANIAGATARTFTIAAVTPNADGARFRAVVSNDVGGVASNAAVLTLSTNRAPTGTMTSPVAGTLYSGGLVIAYAGTAADPEQGTLPASAFTWRVDFHHATHIHPFVPPTSGARSGSFTVPRTGHTETNVWYRIHLTVRDAGGLTYTTYRDIRPRVVQLTLATNPPGLRVQRDGQPVTTPVSFPSVVGIVRTLGAVTPQGSGGTTYEFGSWSDDGDATHNIVTPSVNRTYTARYRVATGGTGLSARYFDSAKCFTGGSATRVDATAKVQWGHGSPAPTLAPERLSARWMGEVRPRFGLASLGPSSPRPQAAGQEPRRSRRQAGCRQSPARRVRRRSRSARRPAVRPSRR